MPEATWARIAAPYAALEELTGSPVPFPAGQMLPASPQVVPDAERAEDVVQLGHEREGVRAHAPVGGKAGAVGAMDGDPSRPLRDEAHNALEQR